MFKIYEHQLPWWDKTAWRWPSDDEKLVLVFRDVFDIDTIMKHIDNSSVCVQAGGACGVWPLRFSQLFSHVYTFEPQPINYKCLKFNTAEADNITAFNAPLSDAHKKYVIHNEIFERKNFGAGYVIPDDSGLEATTIDELEVNDCGLIQLDIEGHELQALKGGAKTIDKYRPVIVLEEKPLMHMKQYDHTVPRRWLEENYGYRKIDACHRDVILCAQ